MAEVIEFKKAFAPDGHYVVSGGDTIGFSGRYVRESDYNALLERHKRLVDAANRFKSNIITFNNRHIHDEWDLFKAALAEEE